MTDVKFSIEFTNIENFLTIETQSKEERESMITLILSFISTIFSYPLWGRELGAWIPIGIAIVFFGYAIIKWNKSKRIITLSDLKKIKYLFEDFYPFIDDRRLYSFGTLSSNSLVKLNYIIFDYSKIIDRLSKEVITKSSVDNLIEDFNDVFINKFQEEVKNFIDKISTLSHSKDFIDNYTFLRERYNCYLNKYIEFNKSVGNDLLSSHIIHFLPCLSDILRMDGDKK